MAVAIETFKRLGGGRCFSPTPPADCANEWLPPSLVSISDHINFSGANPLIGRHSDDRFVR